MSSSMAPSQSSSAWLQRSLVGPTVSSQAAHSSSMQCCKPGTHSPTSEPHARVGVPVQGQPSSTRPLQSSSTEPSQSSIAMHAGPQTWFWQWRLAQSLLTRHVPPIGQPSQIPPQSRSDSEPLVVASAHVASTQNPSAPQTSLKQSVPALHRLPATQGEHAPPQSMSDSVPFGTPSEQAGSTHSRPRHAPLAQSRPDRQGAPTPHPGHSPPQSV